MRKLAFASAAVSLIWLAACAAPAPGAVVLAVPVGGTSDMRILVKLVKASADTEAIAAKVAAAAGTPARYVSATSPQWHALELACAGPAACDAALRRLSANTSEFEVAQRDERKRIVTP